MQPLYEDKPSNPLRASMTEAHFDLPPRVAGRKTRMGMHWTTQTRAAKHQISAKTSHKRVTTMQTALRYGSSEFYMY